MKICSGIYWDQGRREVNEDSLALIQVMTDRGRVVFALVSDGIGGLEEGETASGYIAEKLVEIFYKQIMSLIGRRKGKRSIKKSILRCLYGVRQELVRYAAEREIRLGATVSVLLIWKRKYLIFHLGDSRIYLLGRKKTRLLTMDHSDGGNGLLKCLGSFPFQYPDISFGRIGGKKGFLLCTDGFFRRMDQTSFEMLTPAEVGEDEQIEKRLQGIAASSLKKGETDNMTAVYIKVL